MSKITELVTLKKADYERMKSEAFQDRLFIEILLDLGLKEWSHYKEAMERFDRETEG